MLTLIWKNNYNVVICDILEEKLEEAKNNLEKLSNAKGSVLALKCDVTVESDLQKNQQINWYRLKKCNNWFKNSNETNFLDALAKEKMV